MLDQIFYWILNLSILGSATGIIVLLLRRIRRFPRFGIYLLWLLPIIRFWMPVGFANRYSLLNFLSRYTTKTVLVWEAVPHFTMSNTIMAAETYFPIEYKTNLLKDIFSVCGIIWAVVAMGAVFCSVLLYCFTKSAVKNAVHITGNVYRSDKITSPAVYGIIRPKIILPAAISDGDLEYILLHERVHIRRRDNLWRIIAVTTACVHWFNPLAWLLLKCFFSDMELACDSGILKKLDQGGQKAYASALLSVSSGKTYYASAFGGAKTRLRIENILSYRKLTLVSGLCFAVLFAIIVFTVITNAVG